MIGALALLFIGAEGAGAVETVWIPMEERGLFGGVRRIRLEGTLYRPEGDGKTPIVVFSVHAFHRAFADAGGSAELHTFPPIGHDGHTLPPGSVAVWQAAVDGFLRRIGLGDRG